MRDVYAIQCRARDLVAGDHLVNSFYPVTTGDLVTRVEIEPNDEVLVWFDGEPTPYRYDGRHGLPIIRTRRRVVTDLVRVLRE